MWPQAVRIGVVLIIAALIAAAPPAAAQRPAGTELFTEAYRLIVAEAFTHPGATVLLQGAISGMDRALRERGIPPPLPAPLLSGQEREDLQATLTRLEDTMRLMPPGVPPVELAYAAIKSMVAAVGDASTVFYTPEEWVRLQAELRARTAPGVGVGLRLGEDAGRVVVAAVLEDTPAAQAGILPGDVVLSVGGESVEGRTLAQVQGLIDGEEGQTLALESQRPATGETLTVSLTRVRITIPNVSGRMLRPAIGYLRLRVFSSGAADQVAGLLRRLQQDGARGLAVDLRGNPGGFVTEIVAVASHFIADGPVATIRRKGDRVIVYRAEQREPRFTGALVALVDRATGSGAEIVAGSLQELGVKVVGEQTTGADSVALVFALSGGSFLSLTLGRITTRNGRALGGRGVTPDELVALGPAVIGTAADQPLQAAVRMLGQTPP